ncbi:hypothetical protein [Pedobacter cryophilus]|uniref:hypothetical protein n=1 Tax=Pedobacter cryophilus TaxID=2571271 RepID=UPI00145DDD81|nr:hypothetical protein [Pedobacter cryophilus]
METLTIKQQLEMFTNAKNALEQIPEIHRSRFHSDYLMELKMRVNELNECLKRITS